MGWSHERGGNKFLPKGPSALEKRDSLLVVRAGCPETRCKTHGEKRQAKFMDKVAPESAGYESESEVAQSCPTLRDPMDCSQSGSSVHGIFQAIVLEWIAISFSNGSSRPRDRTQGFDLHCRQTLYHLSHLCSL